MTILEDTIRAREAFYKHMNLWVYKHPDRPPSINNKYSLTINSLTVDVMHQYARTVREYLLAEGIPTTYDSGWSPHMEVNVWTYSWWVEGYELGALLLGSTIPTDTCIIRDTRISLNSYRHQIVGSWHGSLRYQGVRELVPLLRVTSNGMRAYHQCGTCHYSDKAIEYCGAGGELLSDCDQYIRSTLMEEESYD